MATRYAKSTLSDWPCPDPNCGNVNFARRDACNRCGVAKPFEKKPSGSKKIGREIGKSLAEKSKGLFSAEDWQCTHCGNVNWARRNTCNICNSSKFGKVEERTGLGGGYNERENVEYVERDESDGEYDEFGRKKKKFRGQLTSGNSSDEEKGNIAKGPKDPDDVFEKASKTHKSHIADDSIHADDDSSSPGQSKNIEITSAAPKMPTETTKPAFVKAKVDAETDDEEEDEEEDDEDLSKYDLDAASDLVEENKEGAVDENDATASSSDTSSKGSSDDSSSDSEANSDSSTKSLESEQADKKDKQTTKRRLRAKTNGESTSKKRKKDHETPSSSSESTSGSGSDDSDKEENPKSNKLNTNSTIKSVKSTTKTYTSTLTKTSASQKQTTDSDDDQKAIPLPQS